MFLTTHPIPVEYAGESEAEVIKGYPKYLREFILHRLDDTLHPLMEGDTKGRRGKRPGAGRLKGAKKPPTKVVRLPPDIAAWIGKPASISQVRHLMGRARH